MMYVHKLINYVIFFLKKISVFVYVNFKKVKLKLLISLL